MVTNRYGRSMTADEVHAGPGVHNAMSGAAQSVVQAGSIGSVVFAFGRQGAEPVTPYQLPWPPSSFVGREGELAALDLALADTGSASLWVVSGTAGVGKTALVLHWAHRAANRFPDGILYANLRGFADSTPRAEPGEVLDTFLEALGRSAEPRAVDSVEARAAEFRSALHGRRMLIVLDDVATAHQVRPLLPGATTVAVVVTSRNSLPGLRVREGGKLVSLSPLSPDEAVALLARIVDDGRVSGDTASAAELVSLCDSLPLPLLVAAQRLVSMSHLSIADLVEELRDERDRLDLLQTDETATTVRAVFSMSYRALDPEASRVFRLMGLQHGGDIGFDAIAALTGLRRARLRNALESLGHASLVEMTGPGRYRLHDLLRLFARECADAEETAGNRTQAVRAMLDYYLGQALAAGRRLAPHRRLLPQPVPGGGVDFDDRESAFTWCALEQANLVAEVRYAAGAGEEAIAWQLAAAMGAYFHQRKPWSAWIETHETGLRAAQEIGDNAGMATLLGNLAIAYRELRRRDEAEACFRDALALWEQEGDLTVRLWSAPATAMLAVNGKGSMRDSTTHSGA